jgi:hypothetical protein
VRYAQNVGGPGGRQISADIEITEYESDRLIAFRPQRAGPASSRRK